MTDTTNVPAQTLTPTLAKQAKQTAINGKAGSIDQATRTALLEKQDIDMHNPVEEVEIEEVDEPVDMGEALDQLAQEVAQDEGTEFSNCTDISALVGESFESIKPTFTLQLIVPLMSKNINDDTDLEVTDESGAEWSFNNTLKQTNREGKPGGVIYDGLITLLNRLAELNSSNYIIAGNALTQNVALELLAENFELTMDLGLPAIATEEAFEEIVGFQPFLGAVPNADNTGIIINFVVPMPIVAAGSVAVDKFLSFLGKIVSRHAVPTEILFVADPMEFIFDDEQLSTVRSLSDLDFSILSLETLVSAVDEVIDFSIEVEDEDDEFSESADSDFTEEDEVDEDEDEDGDDIIDDDDEIEEDQIEEPSDFNMTMPKSMSGLEQTLFQNGIQAMGTIILAKKL